jgi:hypothetical protein
MSEMMDVINAFGTPLKLAWVGWIAWGIGQYFWFRRERSMPAKRVTSVAKAVAKKPAAPKPVATQAAEAPVVGRLFTPTHVAAQTKPTVPVAPQPEPTPAPPPVAVPMEAAVAPEPPLHVFDPSTAVIEQFGASTDTALDKFVRDFEMQDARPRRRRTRVPDAASSYGAEAPQVP